MLHSSTTFQFRTNGTNVATFLYNCLAHKKTPQVILPVMTNQAK